MDTGSGEYGERRLEHMEGAGQFYRDLRARSIEARIGMEASAYTRWFEELTNAFGGPRDESSWSRCLGAFCWWRQRRSRCAAIPTGGDTICTWRCDANEPDRQITSEPFGLVMANVFQLERNGAFWRAQ
jgi:hypothetical protein